MYNAAARCASLIAIVIFNPSVSVIVPPLKVLPFKLVAFKIDILEGDTKLAGVLSMVSDNVINTVFVPRSIAAATS